MHPSRSTIPMIRIFGFVEREGCVALQAYSKEENAIVERYNKEINRHLRALTFENLSLTDYKNHYHSYKEFLILIITIG